MVTRPLRSSVGAHYGSMDWLAQRVSAILMALYTFIVLAIVMWNGGVDYANWNALLGSNAFRLLTFLFMVAPLRIVGGTGSPVNPLAVL